MSAQKGRTPPYYGGKSGYGKARWINSLLPAPSKQALYAEPYGGFASVMLDREPSGIEFYNDVNDRLVNWWEVVLFETERFGQLLDRTPHSERLFEKACRQVDDMSLPPIRRAWAFHIIITQSVIHTDGLSSNWAAHSSPNVGSISVRNWATRLASLEARMRDVQIRCRPAVEEMARLAKYEFAVVYVDPPYPTASAEYRYNDIDIPELTEALLAQRGFCAISGYGDEWDALGWHRHQRNAIRRNPNAKSEPRVEVVWTNQRPPQYLL